MIDPKMEKAFNEQINAELHSAYLYQAMAAYFTEKNLTGCAAWMKAQAMEEMTHAGKFYDHILTRGGHVKLTGIKEVPDAFESPLAAFKAAYAHEQYITKRIHDLADLADEIHDHAAKPMLTWFVAEQVEEEANTDALVQKLTMVNGEGNGLFMIDQELASRAMPYLPNPAVAAQ